LSRQSAQTVVRLSAPSNPPHFTPQKHYYFYVSGTHFCQRLGKPQGLVRPEGLGKFKIYKQIGIRRNFLKHFMSIPRTLIFNFFTTRGYAFFSSGDKNYSVLFSWIDSLIYRNLINVTRAVFDKIFITFTATIFTFTRQRHTLLNLSGQ
jgi:hypothetical protein